MPVPVYKIKLVALLLLVMHAHGALAQRVYESGLPEGIAGVDIESYRFELNISARSIDSVKNLNFGNRKTVRFAVQQECSLNRLNSGVVRDKGNVSIWYLPVRSKGAESLNVIFTNFRLEKGERLFVYNREQSTIRGPFTWQNNNDQDILALLPVPGDEMIIELQLNSGSSSVPVAAKISHDFIGILHGGDTKDYYFGSSGPCNIDINCSLGDDWQVEKRSVVRILVAGNELGSGALVNNTNQENIPYLLTAEHLVNSQQKAEESIFIFGYESPWCNGPDGLIDKSLSGSDLVAMNAAVDMSLLRLSSFPPVTYKPYLSGWDASGTIPTGSVTIHHPAADVKKITIDLHQPIISTFEKMMRNAFWQVLQWEHGTTEGGSSGAPLFNQDHRIVGYLTGGEAVCGRSVNDYFGRFDIAWDVTDYMFMSLKAWLDPAQSGLQVLNGRDPYAPNFEAGDTIGGLPMEEALVTVYDLPREGYTTGLNSDSIIAYAGFMPYAGSGYVTELYARVGKASCLNDSDSVTFFIAPANGGTPGDPTATRKVFVCSSKDSFLLQVHFDEPVPVSGDFYAGYMVWYRSPLSAGQPQFAVCHSEIIPVGENSAWFRDQSGWHPFTLHPEDPSERNLDLKAIVISDPLFNSVAAVREAKEIFIYPNPAKERVTLLLPEPYPENYIVTLTDMAGRILYQSGPQSGQQHEISGLDSFAPGVYLLGIDYRGGYKTQKLIIGGKR